MIAFLVLIGENEGIAEHFSSRASQKFPRDEKEMNALGMHGMHGGQSARLFLQVGVKQHLGFCVLRKIMFCFIDKQAIEN